jgi:TnpA family transposase
MTMYARVRELLTPEERLQYLQIPPDLGEYELGTYFTFTQHDLEIIQQRRRDYNRLGFAMQLCVLRYLGWTLSDVKEVPAQILRYTAKQINADEESFASYGEREATKYEHLEEIRKEYGYQTFTLSEYRSLCKHLFKHAMANGNPLHLIQLALEDLRKRKIILPSMATIERSVWETRKRTEEKIFKLLSTSLTDVQIVKLDRVLTTMPDNSKTFLAWLREIPGTCSPDSFLKVIEKLEYIRDLQLHVDTKGIHPNRLRQLSKIGSRYEPHSLRRFNDPKKYAILVAYL